MNKPVLHLFTISHYCEKARWTLEHLNIEHEINVLTPLSYRKNAQRLGLARGSVPIVETNGQIIQGSNKIVSWAEQNTKENKNLNSQHDAVSEAEQRLDEVLGVHVRRAFYSEALLEHPASVRKLFAMNISMFEQAALRLAWSKISSMMAKGMDLGYEQGLESIAIIEQEISWLNSLLDAGQEYLVGDQLSSADLSAASLLAPVFSPSEYALAQDLVIPPRLMENVNTWSQQPVADWVKKTYAAWR